MILYRLQGHLQEFKLTKCGLCINYCKVTASCIPSENVTLDRCFWEDLTTGVTTYKNEEVIEYTSVIITVGLC
jgi:ferredoxin